MSTLKKDKNTWHGTVAIILLSMAGLLLTIPSILDELDRDYVVEAKKENSTVSGKSVVNKSPKVHKVIKTPSELSKPVAVVEELENVCSPGDAVSCDTGLSGICNVGIRYCIQISGVYRWDACLITTAPGTSEEECGDGIDNDCDGQVDENCVGGRR